MSPRPAAPSRASVIAWSTTSASLWPARPRVVRHCDAAEHDRAFAGKGVDVEAHAGARDRAARRAIARRGSKSAAVVSLSSAGSPSTAATLMPAARSDGRFVGRRGARPLRHRPAAARRGGKPAASARGPGRRGRPARRAVRRRAASVSPTGSTGAAPSKNSRLASSRSMTSGGQKGRAASWTSTASPSIAARPARTESARSAPPSMNSPTSRPAAPPPASSSWPSPITTRTASIARVADQRLDRPAQHRLAAERRNCLGTPPPRRSPLPAATMRAVTVMRAASRPACLVRQGLFQYLRAFP